MADGSRWRDFGRYRAQGISGGDALGYGIERMVTGIRSSPDTPRGVRARAKYLNTPAGREAMREAGITATPRTTAAWQAGTRMPTKANRARLDSAYWTLRRRNVAADLKRRLYNGGRGTRIEIDPVDQSQVHPKHRRSLNTRHLTVRPRHWDTRRRRLARRRRPRPERPVGQRDHPRPRHRLRRLHLRLLRRLGRLTHLPHHRHAEGAEPSELAPPLPPAPYRPARLPPQTSPEEGVLMTRNTTAPPTCAGHNELRPAERDACHRAMPAGHQQQAAFLFQQWAGNLAALAAWLNVRPRTLQRHLKGSRLPPSGRLRRRLRQGALHYGCPIETDLRAEESRRAAERGIRRTRRRRGEP